MVVTQRLRPCGKLHTDLSRSQPLCQGPWGAQSGRAGMGSSGQGQGRSPWVQQHKQQALPGGFVCATRVLSTLQQVACGAWTGSMHTRHGVGSSPTLAKTQNSRNKSNQQPPAAREEEEAAAPPCALCCPRSPGRSWASAAPWILPALEADWQQNWHWHRQ